MKNPVDQKPTFTTVAVVGTGVIGRSWACLFLRAGCRTRIYDSDPAQVEQALDWLNSDLDRDLRDGLIDERERQDRGKRVSSFSSLAEVLSGAAYVQESGPERLDLKQALYRDLDRLATSEKILGSSTSTLDMSDIARGLPGAARCVVAHPFNPPHMIPAVEVVPGQETSPETVEAVCSFLSSVGQTPVRAKRYAFGFVGNRLQAALVQEALHMVSSGIADVEAVDAVVQEGLGLRWAIMGPFGVANMNADGGVREYYHRFQQAYIDLMKSLGPRPSFDKDLIEKIGEGVDSMMDPESLAEVRRWRDQMIQKICRMKAEKPMP
jgi:3-hydroxyacyl-CoA dehydrogenase